MRKEILIIAVFCIFVFSSGIYADISIVGSTSNNFLKIPAPAKAEAMGEAYTALGRDVDSIFYNPAGLAKSMLSQVSATHIIWFQQVEFENVNLLLASSFGHLAFSISMLHMTPMDKTLKDASASGYSTLYRFSPGSFYGTFSYAKEFTDNLFVGSTIKILNFSIDPEDSSGSAISFMTDVGLVYDMPFLKGASAGLMAKNLGPSTAFVSESFMQPIIMRAGLGYSASMFSVETDAEYSIDNDINFFTGVSLTLFDMLTLRAGYKGGTISVPSFGAGFEMSGASIDYAFMPDWGENLGFTQRVTASIKFGSPEVKLAASPYVFSPNADRFYDYTFLKPKLMAEDKVSEYTLNIYNSEKTPIRSIKINDTGKRLFWNGYNSFKSVVPDGRYYADLKVKYRGNIQSTSNLAAVEVDNTPPDVKVDANPKRVKPGKMIALEVPVQFTPSLYDIHGIGKWKLIITDKNGKIFKTFSGVGESLGITWDGSDNTGVNYVSTGSVYAYTFYASDKVGNWGRSVTKKVTVLLREIIITLDADTLFDPAKADVKINVYKQMQAVVAKLKAHKQKTIIVEGHTDNRPLRRGKYRDNMELSKYRAQAVVKFFVELFGMDERVFKAVGRGATMPVASNDTPEGRKKNRRVTIHMRASEWE